MNVIYII